MGSSWAGDRTCVLCISRQILNPWTSRDVLGKNHSVTIFYLLSAGRITLSLSVILVFRAVFGDSINMSALQMETLRFRVAKSFFSYKRTGGMCGQQLNPELDGSEEANAEREGSSSATSCALSAWLDPVEGWAVPVHLPLLSWRIPLHLHPPVRCSIQLSDRPALPFSSCAVKACLALLPTQFPPRSWVDHKEG